MYSFSQLTVFIKSILQIIMIIIYVVLGNKSHSVTSILCRTSVRTTTLYVPINLYYIYII